VAHCGGAGSDKPYRRALLDGNRGHAVLKQGCRRRAWNRPRTERSWAGVSLHQNFGNYAAVVVEVQGAPRREISLEKIGRPSNAVPDQSDIIRAQIEGASFSDCRPPVQRLTFAQGRVEQGNFNE